MQVRTQYQNTIKNLESVFKDEQLEYLIYESLLTLESLKKFQTFSMLE